MDAKVALTFVRTRAPGASDDASGGYAAGTFWVDNAGQRAYVCVDASQGAAIWTEMTTAPPPPPVGTLPFAEANLRPGFTRETVPIASQEYRAPTGRDILLDLEGLKRTIGSLLVYGNAGQRIKVINGWWEITKPTNDGAHYWRGGPRARANDSVGAEHMSFTNMLVQGPSIPDCMAFATQGNTKVTYQKFRHESRFAWDGGDCTEPAEHCDSFQVQGPTGPIEVGYGTTWCQNVAAPNEGGKCFQLKREGGGPPFTVKLNKVNMRGGGRTGTFFLQTTRDIVCDLVEVYANDDGITTGANWNWSTPGGGMFNPNNSAPPAWVRSGVAGAYICSWPASAGITGQIKQGLPPTGDFMKRTDFAFYH